MKRIIRDYLYFSKQERIAVILLLLLMGAFIVLPYLYPPRFEPPVINQALADWLAESNDSSDNMLAAGSLPASPASFPFDPNTAAEKDWQRLGIPLKTIRTILHYRSKGGRFRKPDDIRKIWGISTADAERLVPYVRIAGDQNNAGAMSVHHEPAVVFRKEPAVIDINTATAAEWASLPGIGTVLSDRIVRYRDKIGGFRSVQQVAKTYGIGDSLFNSIYSYLRCDASHLPKPNLNTASVYALVQAGLDQRFARELVRYREQHGPYRSFEDLHKLVEMPDSSWQKMLERVKLE